MKKYSASEIQRAVMNAKITRIFSSECPECGEVAFYTVENGNLFFHGGCQCRYELAQHCEWQDLARWVDIKLEFTPPAKRAGILLQVGIYHELSETEK